MYVYVYSFVHPHPHTFSISPATHPLGPPSLCRTEGKTVAGRSTAGPAALPAKAETLRSCGFFGDPRKSPLEVSWLLFLHALYIPYVLLICLYVYNIYISSNVNGINVNTQMLFFRWECPLELKLWLSHAGLIRSPSSVLRRVLQSGRHSWNLKWKQPMFITLLALAESSSLWTLLPHSFWVKFAAFTPVSVWNFRRKYVQAHIDLLDIAL